MQRCLELAALGAGRVAPNPMVGAVLVHNNRIIGEGYHRAYGGPHAEVNCIDSVTAADRHLVAASTLYVSLEPCAHFGKTPPCADLIIRSSIPVCKIGCRDPFVAVNGKGIDRLITAGVEVETGILEKDCQELNRRFFTFHLQKRPYIVLKWAQTADRYIGIYNETGLNAENANKNNSSACPRLLISGEYTNRLVHQWRSEEAAIMVGTNTALHDNPSLTNRLWSGPSPIRLVPDMQLRLPHTLKLFTDDQRTIIFNAVKSGEKDNCTYYLLNKNENLIPQILRALYALGIQSVLVEGGSTLLQSFIDQNAWDEARVITNRKLTLTRERQIHATSAPLLKVAHCYSTTLLSDDEIQIFKPFAR
jgi:diaminohydroxyphosphoribosylaminopyrimidine deaminase/5-amino-6-(5-phosphoribosylamino)uracil reductase